MAPRPGMLRAASASPGGNVPFRLSIMAIDRGFGYFVGDEDAGNLYVDKRSVFAVEIQYPASDNRRAM